MEKELQDFYPLVRAMARRYQGSGLEREDLEQEAWAALLEARRDYRPELGTPRPAYYRLRIRGALRQVLRRYRRDALSRAWDRIDCPEAFMLQDTPEEYQLINLLPLRQQQVLELRANRGYPLTEVAKILGISQAATYTHYRRGRGRLAVLIKEGWNDPR